MSRSLVASFRALCAVSVPFYVLGCACPCAEKPATTAPAATTRGAALPGAPGAVVAIKKCTGALVPAANGLIDDLDDNDNRVLTIEGRGGYWWDAKDDKGSTIEPTNTISMSEGGAHGSKFAVRVFGKTAPQAEMAWGAVVGFRLAQTGLYDASKYAGISFFAKAGEKSGSLVRLKVADVNTHPDGKVCKEGCYNDFGKDFSLSKDWQEYQVSFAEMTQQDGWGDPRPPAITPDKLVQVAWHLATRARNSTSGSTTCAF